MALDTLIVEYWWLLLAVALWTIPWKGVALWKAARNGDRWWFVILLIISDLAVLELLYIFVFSKPKGAGVKKRQSKAV